MRTLHLLLDIDGTLVLTGGAGQQAMGDVVAGRRDSDEWQKKVTFSGRTDRSILVDLMRLYQVDPSEENVATYTNRYVSALGEYLARHEGHVLPGVLELLECISQQSRVNLGLLTGNIRRAAQLKLDHYHIGRFFFERHPEAVGGFGDRHLDRNHVAADALAEVSDQWQPNPDPRDVWIVGDTPNDIRCARAIGAHVLAVATGGYSLEELESHKPDVAVPNFHEAHDWWDRMVRDHGLSRP